MRKKIRLKWFLALLTGLFVTCLIGTAAAGKGEAKDKRLKKDLPAKAEKGHTKAEEGTREARRGGQPGKAAEPGHEGHMQGKDKDKKAEPGHEGHMQGKGKDKEAEPGERGRKLGHGKQRCKVSQEQRKHLKRMAKIARLDKLAKETNKPKLVEKTNRLVEKENRRHNRFMSRCPLKRQMGKAHGHGKPARDEKALAKEVL
jgi:hypothetical protein